jgi:hypothetical protein
MPDKDKSQTDSQQPTEGPNPHGDEHESEQNLTITTDVGVAIKSANEDGVEK